MALLLLPAAGGTRLSGAAGNEFLFVWMTKDQDKLNTLIKKLFPASRSGSIDGAALYTSGSYALTVSGATVVFAANRSLLQAALDRHAQNGGIGAAQYTRETAGLPQGSLVRVFGDLSGVLSAPRAAQGRRIPWVAALRGYGASIDAGNSGLSIRFHLDTSGARLSASQLPIAGGSAAASLASSSPISTAVHDLWRRGRGERWAGCQGSARYGCSLAQLVMGLAPIMGWRNIPGNGFSISVQSGVPSGRRRAGSGPQSGRPPIVRGFGPAREGGIPSTAPRWTTRFPVRRLTPPGLGLSRRTARACSDG